VWRIAHVGMLVADNVERSLETNTNGRQPIPKSVRFEVFKRDSFRCQYCGATAPEVLLQIDHIAPVSKGGTNDIVNLLTSCAACNAGKSDRTLDDNTAVVKSRRQMEELQERREQLEMMMAWREGLRDVQEESVGRVCDYWHRVAPGYTCTGNAKADVAKWIRQFSIAEVCHAMDIAAEQYLSFKNDGAATAESWDTAFAKIPGICIVDRASVAEPDLKDIYYIRGIVRKRLDGRYFDGHKCLEWLRCARSWDVPIEDLRALAKRITSWTRFVDAVCDAIDERKKHGEDAT
jgi:hypothetical protein